MLQDDISGAAEHLLDAAPVERSYLEAALADVIAATGDRNLVKEIETAALAYAMAAADRAYALGLQLGQEGVIQRGDHHANSDAQSGGSG